MQREGDMDLRSGEVELVELEENIWRQVNPAFVHDGRVSSQAFTPSSKDGGELSSSRASRVTAKESFDHYVQILKLQSFGVYSLTVGEVRAEDLRVIDDSAVGDGENRPPGHVYVDFKGISRKDAKKAAGKLRSAAEKHGWAYLPGAGTDSAEDST
jgi:hypothetical protein